MSKSAGRRIKVDLVEDEDGEDEKPTKSSLNSRIALVILLIAAGMAGLYFNVEYSGWVLAVGLLGALDT